ncbi:hypothetical protein LCGC14_1846220 [marine sediment metagenome]|uniref:Uncharacterized protein n=1 Tax=marine sediment metagenome TaxID=412755 RepID=A0A0F9H022_9ZZZZ
MSQGAAKPENRPDDPEPRETETKVNAKEVSALSEGQIVAFTLPKTWPTNSRGQVRPAIVVFCYRNAAGHPTGTVNLVVFLNGPADTGDMAGPKTRTVSFENGVKRAEKGGGEPGRWYALQPSPPFFDAGCLSAKELATLEAKK